MNWRSSFEGLWKYGCGSFWGCMDASGAQVVVSVLLICSKGARHRTSEAKTGDVHYQEGSIGVELSDKTNDLHPLRYIYVSPSGGLLSVISKFSVSC